MDDAVVIVVPRDSREIALIGASSARNRSNCISDRGCVWLIESQIRSPPNSTTCGFTESTSPRKRRKRATLAAAVSRWVSDAWMNLKVVRGGRAASEKDMVSAPVADLQKDDVAA